MLRIRPKLGPRGERDCWGAPMEPDPEQGPDASTVKLERCPSCNRVLSNPGAGSFCAGFYCEEER
jgi:hypothetical protein